MASKMGSEREFTAPANGDTMVGSSLGRHRMADDNAARNIDDTAAQTDGRVWRVQTAPWPNPLHDDLVQQLESPEWNAALGIPKSRKAKD